jgi:ribosomal protein S27AE
MGIDGTPECITFYNPAEEEEFDNEHFCSKCGQSFANHNDDGSCVEDS